MELFLVLFFLCICMFYMIMFFCFVNKAMDVGAMIYVEYDASEINEDLNGKSDEELALIFAKNVISRQVLDSSSVNWGREKIIEKDEFNKYLIYIEYTSKNAFGVNINSSSLICIKLDENKNTFSYRQKGSFIEFGRVENLNELTVLKQYKKYFSFGKNVLYKKEYDEKYKFKNFFKWTNSSIKKFINLVKTNRLVDAILVLVVIIIGWIIIINSNIVTVPNLVGKTISEAKAIINEEPLELDIRSAGDDNEKIIQQWPENGKVKLNQSITITTKEYEIEQAKPSTLDVINAAKTVISKNLRAPSTAIWGNECQVLDSDDYGRFLTYITVEAQNGFGGYVESAYMVVLQSVNSYGNFKYNPYFSYIESSVISGYINPVDSYKNGTVSTPVQQLLEMNNWNKEKEETEN